MTPMLRGLGPGRNGPSVAGSALLGCMSGFLAGDNDPAFERERKKAFNRRGREGRPQRAQREPMRAGSSAQPGCHGRAAQSAEQEAVHGIGLYTGGDGKNKCGGGVGSEGGMLVARSYRAARARTPSRQPAGCRRYFLRGAMLRMKGSEAREKARPDKLISGR
jgi:hypothetical protein